MTRNVLLAVPLSVAVAAILSAAAPACSSPPPPSSPSTHAEDQQHIIDRAAHAVRIMRQNPRLAGKMDDFIPSARAVVVFPRLIKASVVFGGEGGNGVMVVRRADGSWSPPAFYSLGAASAGLQIGYQETSAVFFIMRERTVELALDSSFRLGADASVAAGYVGTGGKGVSGVASEDIYAFTEVGGAFVGISFDGHVMGPRDKHNYAYYGRAVSPRDILLGQMPGVPAGADAVARALALDGASAPAPSTTSSGN